MAKVKTAQLHREMQTMPVSLIMTQNPTTIGTTCIIADLAQLFKESLFHHVPVVDDDGMLAGIISDRDIAACIGSQRDSDQVLATSIMSTNLITADPTTTIECASILLLENQISALPIVNDDDELVGILSWKDILRFYVYH